MHPDVPGTWHTTRRRQRITCTAVQVYLNGRVGSLDGWVYEVVVCGGWMILIICCLELFI